MQFGTYTNWVVADGHENGPTRWVVPESPPHLYNPPGFDPTTEHEYGFDWYPNKVDFLIDGSVVGTIRDTQTTIPSEPGALCLNIWAADWEPWQGPPPVGDTFAYIDNVSYTPDDHSDAKDDSATNLAFAQDVDFPERRTATAQGRIYHTADIDVVADVDVFRFDAEAGQRVSVRLSDADPSLEGDYLVEYYDGASLVPVYISPLSDHEFIAPESGRYYVAVSGPADLVYTLEAVKTDIPLLKLTQIDFFDDFDYDTSLDQDFRTLWIDRPTEDGWGAAGHAASFVDVDDGAVDSRVMVLSSSTSDADGPSTSRVESRFEIVGDNSSPAAGTYAALVQFGDLQGTDAAEANIQSFYAIHPAYDDNPDYSEVDFEYLTNRGWNGTDPGDFLQVVSWDAKTDPQDSAPANQDDRVLNTTELAQSYQGSGQDGLDGQWSLLVFQVDDGGQIRYFVNTDQAVVEEGNPGTPFVPAYRVDHPMALAFSNWLCGPPAGGSRQYDMLVDWVYYSPDNELKPSEVAHRAAEMQALSLEDDRFRGNDSRWTAQHLNDLGETYEDLVLLDTPDGWQAEDWFSVYLTSEAQPGSEIRVSCDRPNAIALEVLDTGFVPVGTLSFPDAYQVVCDVSGLPADLYYIRVYSDQDLESLRYTLTMNILDAGADVNVMEVIDRSGSMEGQNIADAKVAAKLFVDLMNQGDRIGVASYEAVGSVDYALTQVTADGSVQTAAKAAIDALVAVGATSIGAGIQAANGELDPLPTEPGRAMIVMTDGQHNWPPDPLAVINSEVDADVSIYTIGFGVDADTALLTRIAGLRHGQYYYASSGAELQNIYAALLGTAGGMQQIQNTSGAILPLQQISTGLSVDPSAAQLLIGLNWTGSDLDLELVAPDDTVITHATAATDPDIELVEAPTYEFFRIDAPMAGDWEVRVQAVDVPPVENRTISTPWSTRPSLPRSAATKVPTTPASWSACRWKSPTGSRCRAPRWSPRLRRRPGPRTPKRRLSCLTMETTATAGPTTASTAASSVGPAGRESTKCRRKSPEEAAPGSSSPVLHRCRFWSTRRPTPTATA